MKRGNLINHLIKKYDFKSYLEIGVGNPNDNFNLIQVELKESVDPAPKGECTYVMTSDEFFKNNIKRYDIIFIDGLHDEKQVYKDIKNSISCLNNDGVIVVHDCNPVLEKHIKPYEEYLKTRGEWYGTTFRGFIKAKKELKTWSCFVVDTDCGCGVITRRKLLKNISSEFTDLSWNEFDKNREKLLQLISTHEFINKCNVYW